MLCIKYCHFRFEDNSYVHVLENSMNSLSSGAKKMADNLTGEVIETNEMFHNESNPSSSAPKTTTGLQSQRQNQSPQNHQVCSSTFTYLLNTC